MKEIDLDKLIVLVFYCKDENGKLKEIARILGGKDTVWTVDELQRCVKEQDIWLKGKTMTLYVAVWGEYFSKKSEYASGYTFCAGAIEVANNEILSLRETTPEETRLIDKHHGKFSEEEKKMYYDTELAIKIRGKYLDCTYSSAEKILGISMDEIKKILYENEPSSKRGNYVYFDVGDYTLRRNKEI